MANSLQGGHYGAFTELRSTFEQDFLARGSRLYRIFQGHGRQQDRFAQHELDHEGERNMSRYFFSKLNPPRPSFAQDMSDEERRLMGEHVAYWKALAEKGVALVFGPVGDPKGAYGICITEVNSEEQIHLITANDPVIKSDLNFSFETYPMLNIVRAP